MAADFAMAAAQAEGKGDKSGSIQTGKKGKDKQSQLSNEDKNNQQRPAKASGSVSNAGGGGPKSAKGSRKKPASGVAAKEPVEENKEDAVAKQIQYNHQASEEPEQKDLQQQKQDEGNESSRSSKKQQVEGEAQEAPAGVASQGGGDQYADGP